MKKEICNKVASANSSAYDSLVNKEYIDGAPHIKHSMLRKLYKKLLIKVYYFTEGIITAPSILDLGSGEGSVTLPFLELGGRVTAVDISNRQLKALKEKALNHADRLEIYCRDASDALISFKSEDRRFDIIVCNSFLHHIPDYIDLIKNSVVLLSSQGRFFSFQDPMRYDSTGKFTSIFSNLAYMSWRVMKGDIAGGIKRRMRRSRGIFHEDRENVEYHAVRDGVDQDAIREFFEKSGFECEIIRYFSTQSSFWQKIGTKLGVENTFAVIAKKKDGYK